MTEQDASTEALLRASISRFDWKTQSEVIWELTFDDYQMGGGEEPINRRVRLVAFRRNSRKHPDSFKLDNFMWEEYSKDALGDPCWVRLDTTTCMSALPSDDRILAEILIKAGILAVDEDVNQL